MANTTKGPKAKEILEDPEAIIDKFRDTEAFFYKNRKGLLYAGIAVVAVILGFIGYKYYIDEENKTAQAEMVNAVLLWERDSLKTALNGGKGAGTGLVDIADQYSATDAGNLANYYTGVALLKEGKFEEAIESLKEFKANDLLVQGQVYSLIGDGYMELKNYEDAVEYYGKAANYKPNESFTPIYLMKLALAYELSKNYDNAVSSYDRIIQEYPVSRQVNDAKKYKARAEGLALSGAEAKK